MENKYYTPEISELYVGYECETKLVDRDTIWWRSEITKYLDSNDIISLGFEEVRIKLLQSYTNTSEKELVGVFIKDNLEINYNFNTNKAYIKDDRNYGAIYFYGLCKSKNELKTLLKLIQ